jgi:hypothetical protein
MLLVCAEILDSTKFSVAVPNKVGIGPFGGDERTALLDRRYDLDD